MPATQFRVHPRRTHGLLGVFDFTRELVAPARVAFHLGTHLVDLRTDSLQVRFGLGGRRLLGRGSAKGE
jgi:hypothetical protein